MARIEQIVAFCKVIELGSFSLAAESLLLSQPTISMQVKSLEDEFGSELLHRDGHKIVLTENGKKIYPEFLKISASYEKARQAIAANQQFLQGDLWIGASSGPAENPLPFLLAEFKLQNEGAKVHLVVGDSSEIIEKVALEVIEIGFVGTKRRDGRLIFEPFTMDNLVLAARPDHIAASKRTIPIHELRKIPLILQQAGSGATINLQEGLSHVNMRVAELNVFMELGLQSSVKSAVMAGYGATIISELGISRELASGELVKIDIEDLNLSRQLFICRNRNTPLSNLGEKFLEFSKAEITPDSRHSTLYSK